MKKEVWKSIELAPNYEISNQGRVRRRTKTGETVELKPSPKPIYLMFYVRIHTNTYSNLYVHREMMKAFKPSKDPSMTHVCFKDGDPYNLSLDNLYWSNQSKRMQRRYKENGYPKGEDHPLSILTEEKVKEIRAKAKVKGALLSEIAREYELDPTTIHFVVDRKSWKHVK